MNLNPIIKICTIFAILAGIWMRFSPEQTPPSLYWEEVALGYDAYSLAETGKDHHGNSWPIIAIESFGDWKPAGYVYTLIPFIKIFGLSDAVVRLPSRIAGVVLIGAVFFLSKLLLKNEKLKYNPLIPWVVAATVALSSWGVMFSRAAWEVNLAVMFTTWGVVGLLYGLKKNRYVAFASVLLFIAAAYTYHAHRMIAPLLLLLTVSYYWVNEVSLSKNEVKRSVRSSVHNLLDQVFTKQHQTAVTTLVIGAILILGFIPFFANFNSPHLTQRFSETSNFSLIEPIEQSNALKEASGNSVISRIIYHRYLLFGKIIVANFFDHFTFDYLFVSGDTNPRHSTGFVGQLYYFDFVLIIFGLYYLRKQKVLLLFFASWIVISILPAALSTGTPHALRTLMVLPVFAILIGSGIIFFIELANKINFFKLSPKHIQLFTIGILIAITTMQTAQFWRYYTKIYPVVVANEWQYGYKEMVEQLTFIQNTYPNYAVTISREYGRPAMYYWFYSKTDPRAVQAFASEATYDQGEFLSYQNITFSSKPDRREDQEIFVTSPSLKMGLENTAETLATVKGRDGEVVWEIYKANQ